MPEYMDTYSGRGTHLEAATSGGTCETQYGRTDAKGCTAHGPGSTSGGGSLLPKTQQRKAANAGDDTQTGATHALDGREHGEMRTHAPGKRATGGTGRTPPETQNDAT